MERLIDGYPVASMDGYPVASMGPLSIGMSPESNFLGMRGGRVEGHILAMRAGFRKEGDIDAMRGGGDWASRLDSQEDAQEHADKDCRENFEGFHQLTPPVSVIGISVISGIRSSQRPRIPLGLGANGVPSPSRTCNSDGMTTSRPDDWFSSVQSGGE